MTPAGLLLPLVGILVFALKGKRKAPESVVVAPEVEGEPATAIETATGEVYAVPDDERDELADAIDGGDEEEIAEVLEDTGVSPTEAEAAGEDTELPPDIEEPPQPVRMPPEVPSVPGAVPRTEGPEQPWQVPPELRPPPEPPALPPVIESVPADTMALATKMIAEEGGPGWKYVDPQVKAWQAKRPAAGVADGMFGQKSALAMATEIGTLPLVRYWPRASLPATALPAYREALDAIADDAPEPRASALRASALREQGQGFGTYTAARPIPAAADDLSAVWRTTLSEGRELSGLAALIATLEPEGAA